MAKAKTYPPRTNRNDKRNGYYFPIEYNPVRIPSGIKTIVDNIGYTGKREWKQLRKRLATLLLTYLYIYPFDLVKFPYSLLRKKFIDRDIKTVINCFIDNGYLLTKIPHSFKQKRATAYQIEPELIAEIADRTGFYYEANPKAHYKKKAVDNCIAGKQPKPRKRVFRNFDTIPDPDKDIFIEKLKQNINTFHLGNAFRKIFYTELLTDKQKKYLWKRINRLYVTGNLQPDYSIGNNGRLYTSHHRLESLDRFLRDDPEIAGFKYGIDINSSYSSINQAQHGKKPDKDLSGTIAKRLQEERDIVKNIINPAISGQSVYGYIAGILKLDKKYKKELNKLSKKYHNEELELEKKKLLNRKAKYICTYQDNLLHDEGIALYKNWHRVIAEARKEKALPLNNTEMEQMVKIEAQIMRNVINRLKFSFMLVHDCIMVRTKRQAELVKKWIAEESKKILFEPLACSITAY